MPMTFALTFDDGPDPVWTPAVLDALAAAGARATFFVLGTAVERHPEPVSRALAEGHAVELHGHGHLRHPEHPEPAIAADADRGLGALERRGVRPRLWRVPWGELAGFTPALARARDLRLAGWTADTRDWRGDDAAAMLGAVEPRLEPGAVVLAHDGVGPGARRAGCTHTVELIGPLVAAARERGLTPGPVPAEVPAGNPELAPA
jgi:peptidoglycan/xylan/chitin deacetylase (PgdA/CDA1 family)